MLFAAEYAVPVPVFRVHLPQSADCGDLIVWLYARQERGHVDWFLLRVGLRYVFWTRHRLFRKRFFPDDIKLPLILIAASDLSYNILVYLFLFLLRRRFQIDYYLLNIMLPELVYTILVTIVLYFVILKINNKLEEIEKRSASKFV